MELCVTLLVLSNYNKISPLENNLISMVQVTSNYYLLDKNSEIIYFSDKFADKAWNFVEIDSQSLAESKTEETTWCYETIVASEDSKFPCFHLTHN